MPTYPYQPEPAPRSLDEIFGARGSRPTTAAPAYLRPPTDNPRRRARREGFQSLYDIIMSRGATDPALFNRQIQGIQRGTESRVNSLEESSGALGYNSGVGSALVEAVKASGGEMISDARAKESALTEERKRSDLNLLLQMILNPKLARRGQNLGLEGANANQGGSSAGQYGQYAALAASILMLLNAPDSTPSGGAPSYSAYDLGAGVPTP